MRIAVWHNLPSGGGKRALFSHIRGLLQRGHHVESWCPSTASQTYLPLGDLIPEHILPLAWSPERDDTLYQRLVGPYQDMMANLRAIDRHCQQCAEEIEAGSFDLLLAGSCAMFRVPPIARHLRIPHVLYLQEPYRWLYEALPRLPWLPMPTPRRWTPRYIFRFVEDLIKVQALRVQAREEVQNARAFNRLLVNSLFSRESLLRAYGLDSTVCYLGIDHATFTYQRRPRDPFLISVGGLIPEKNPLFLVKALSTVREPRPPLVWVANVLGHPRYVDEIVRFAGSVGVRLDLRMNIPDTDLVDLLNRATALLYAPRLEPFGLVPLEANACGLPVIAVPEGGVRETVVHGLNGLLVQPDAHHLGVAIQELLDRPAYARTLGENGVGFVAERWSLDAADDRLEKALFNLVSPALARAA